MKAYFPIENCTCCAADQAFHPGHLHENPMQLYYLNRTIIGNESTLTNYWMVTHILIAP